MDGTERVVGDREVGQVAIEFVIAQWAPHGRTARDTRGQGRGDIESDGRVIEVKAFGSRFDTGILYFTPPQIAEAQQNPNYCVYIVENITQGDPARFELRVASGAALLALIAKAEVQRLSVPIHRDEYRRLPYLDGGQADDA